MPAEWERQAAVWLAWPHDPLTFPDLKAVETAYCALVRTLAEGERVELLVVPDRARRVAQDLAAAGVRTRNVRLRPFAYADVWFRDYGPTCVVNRPAASLALVNWTFNAWGGKYPELLGDNGIPEHMQRWLDLPVFTPGIVLEGGSIDVDGNGTLLTTEQCLLNPNRNPGLRRRDIEDRLEAYLGVRRIIWLGQGIAGDDTDGHIDDIARFVGPRTVVIAHEPDPADANHHILEDNRRRLATARDAQGRPLTIVRLPMPASIEAGAPLPASYTNFLIANASVLVPLFGVPQDTEALSTLAGLFPGRRIVGIDCRAMVAGLGTLHCISQQQPAV